MAGAKVRRYAVIGSNCFTGAHIVDALLEDPDVTVLGISRSPESHRIFLPYLRHGASRFRFVQLDLVRDAVRIQELLDKEQPEVVINVAALSEVGLSNERPVEYFEVNTTAVVRLCNHLRTRPYLRQYVHISSAEVYGSCEGAVKEDAPFRPSTPYAVSKAAADMYLGSVLKNFGFPAVLIRSTNVYGRHQQLFKIIPRTLIYLRQGKTIELHGGGTSVKSFVHIRDVVRGLQLAVAADARGTFNFSVESSRSVAEIVEATCRRAGYDFAAHTRVVGERLGQDGRYWLDCTRAERELGWRPEISFDQGLDETVQWINDEWDAVQTLPLDYQHKVQA